MSLQTPAYTPPFDKCLSASTACRTMTGHGFPLLGSPTAHLPASERGRGRGRMAARGSLRGGWDGK